MHRVDLKFYKIVSIKFSVGARFLVNNLFTETLFMTPMVGGNLERQDLEGNLIDVSSQR